MHFTMKELREKYIKLIKQWHPDVNHANQNVSISNKMCKIIINSYRELLSSVT